MIAWVLDGPDANYTRAAAWTGEAKRAILETYTKEHSAEYQSQALIDLARKMGGQVKDFDAVDSVVIHASHHTHVIGTGAGDPEDGPEGEPRDARPFDHVHLRRRSRTRRGTACVPMRRSAAAPDTVALLHKISTVEDPKWTERYHHTDPNQRAFGGRVVITMKDGTVLQDELAVADAHPAGARPFARENYINKFNILTEDIVTNSERIRFLDTVQKLPDLSAGELGELHVTLNAAALDFAARDDRGIF